MEYSKEEVEMQARIKFPIGTEFRSCIGALDFVDQHKFYWSSDTDFCISSLRNTKRIIYSDGKWATIISTLETKLTFNYLIL